MKSQNDGSDEDGDRLEFFQMNSRVLSSLKTQPCTDAENWMLEELIKLGMDMYDDPSKPELI